MTLYRVLISSLCHTSPLYTTSARQTLAQNPTFLLPIRNFAFSSAEEAAAERRRRNRRLRIEPDV